MAATAATTATTAQDNHNNVKKKEIDRKTIYDII